jgi:hypothetical protein
MQSTVHFRKLAIGVICRVDTCVPKLRARRSVRPSVSSTHFLLSRLSRTGPMRFEVNRTPNSRFRSAVSATSEVVQLGTPSETPRGIE